MLTWWPAATEELSEEDQQLKNDLETLVERLTVCSPRLQMLPSELTTR